MFLLREKYTKVEDKNLFSVMKANLLKLAVSSTAVALIALSFLIATGASDGSKVTLCHATGSATNPYVLITVSTDAVSDFGGHAGHPNDILPTPGNPVTSCPTPNTSPTLNFTASPTSTVIQKDGSNQPPIVLSWFSTNTVSCTASNSAKNADWSGTEPTSDSVNVASTATGIITYTLSCKGSSGPSVQASIDIVYQTVPL